MLSVAQMLVPWWKLPIVVIDFETTGVNAAECMPVEVAAVRFEDGAIVARASSLIDPGIPIPPEATAVHGIADEMVSSADEAFVAIVNALVQVDACDAMPCAYNANFDRTILHRLARAESSHEIESCRHADLPWLDPMVVVKHVDKFAKGKKLTDACARRGIQIGMQAHRAEADAILCGMLLFSTDVRKALGDQTISEVLRRQTIRAAEQEAEFAAWKARQPAQ